MAGEGGMGRGPEHRWRERGRVTYCDRRAGRALARGRMGQVITGTVW